MGQIIVQIKYANDQGDIVYYNVELDEQAVAELITTADRLDEESSDRKDE